MAKCTECGCTRISTDGTNGTTYCEDCGVVVSDSLIIAEKEFSEVAGGQIVAVGSFVSAESSGALASFGLRAGFGRESREITLTNGKRSLYSISEKLSIRASGTVDDAYRTYKLALQYNFTRGRRLILVLAACLYISCRKDKQPVILLDFADRLQVNVFSLGNVYIQLRKLLNPKIENTDPAIYILRYAGKLEFGTKLNAVAHTATRIVSRMRKDWINFGRRPCGLCGAALLIAARMHNFHRTIRDVMRAVRVCNITIRNRLNEFKATEFSSMSVAEFKNGTQLETFADPPSFQRARLDGLHKRESIRYMSKIEQIASLGGRTRIQAILQRSAPMMKALPAPPDQTDDDSNSQYELDSQQEVDTQQENLSQTAIDSNPTHKAITIAPVRISDEDLAIQAISQTNLEITDQQDPNEMEADMLQLFKSSVFRSHAFFDAATRQLALLRQYSRNANVYQNNITLLTAEGDLVSDLSIDPLAGLPTDPVNLDDAYDSEVEAAILSPGEAEIKSQIWRELNKEWLEEDERREQLQSEYAAKGIEPPKKKAKRKPVERYDPDQPNSVEGAVRQALTQKISSKINYNALNLFQVEGNPSFKEHSDSYSAFLDQVGGVTPDLLEPITSKSVHDHQPLPTAQDGSSVNNDIVNIESQITEAANILSKELSSTASGFSYSQETNNAFGEPGMPSGSLPSPPSSLQAVGLLYNDEGVAYIEEEYRPPPPQEEENIAYEEDYDDQYDYRSDEPEEYFD